MEEENFNWVEQYLGIQEKKDIKNSNAFKTLIDNNIDTNELTGHEKETNAGVFQLNYKDEKEKEADSYNYARGLLNFAKDMPEETGKALMLAALNGTDVAANATGVLFNLFTNTDQEMKNAFDRKDEIKFKEKFNSNIKTFSDYLSLKKDKVRAIGEDSETSSKAAEFVSMLFQDAPYGVPIYRTLKRNGMPNWMAVPVAYGMGAGIAFDDDATLTLNSEQVQGFKKMVVDLENSPEEKIFNTTYRMLEGTTLGFLTSPIFKALKFAKNNIPKFNTKKVGEAVGLTAAAGVGATAISGSKAESAIPPKLAVEFLKAAGKKVQDLKKIKGGTGRAVFELDNEKVIKIAKMQRGLRENDLEGDFFVKNWLPKFHTSGRDYVVVENVGRADKELRQFLKPLQKFNQSDFDVKTPELQEALEKMELGDFMNFNVAWRDFIAARNWGKTKDGRFVLLDAGALDLSIYTPAVNKGGLIQQRHDLAQKDWDKVLADRRREGMGKFIIITTAGGQGYRVLDNQQNNIISNKTEN